MGEVDLTARHTTLVKILSRVLGRKSSFRFISNNFYGPKIDIFMSLMIRMKVCVVIIVVMN